jgi:hypothetical protein
MRRTIVQVYCRRGALPGAMALLMGVLSCGELPSSPGDAPEITNKPGYFAYQASGIRDYSGYDFFTWENRGSEVVVHISPSQEAGDALIVLVDADGRHVFAQSASAGGNFPSAEGEPGWWTVRVYCADFTGTVTFSARAKADTAPPVATG